MLCVFYQNKRKVYCKYLKEHSIKDFPLTYIETHYRMDTSIGLSHSGPQPEHSSTLQSETGKWTVPLRLMQICLHCICK